MTETLETVPEVGRARRRKEDARLVTGRTQWTDNIQLPGMLHVAFLRSPMAHARITRVDVSAARGRPGVVAAFSGRDFADEQGSLPCAWPVTEDIVIPDHPPMAVDEVRYVGEAVACVVATDRYRAADAARGDRGRLRAAAARARHERGAQAGARPRSTRPGNKAFTWKFSSGDVEAAFRDAPVVIDRTLPSSSGSSRARWSRGRWSWTTDGETFTLYSATQIPHVLRVMLALTTGIPEHKLRVIAPDVGGGFGSKLQVTAEEVLVPADLPAGSASR